MPSERVSVAVIIPTREKVALVRQCLKSLFASGAEKVAELDVVVIEHGGEESRELIEKDYGGKPVRWMKGEEDWSYSQMNNAAAETAAPDTDYLLLLNNDIICRKDFLASMITAMQEHSDVGVVGAKLIHLDGTIQHIGIGFRTDGVPYHLLHNQKDDGTVSTLTRDDYYDAVTFACVLIRKNVWDEVGGLDEDYFFNYEDIDFCLKAREKGWKAFVPHRAKLVHLEGKSGENRQTKDHSVWRNMKVLKEKWIDTGKMSELFTVRVNTKAGTLRPDRLNVAFIPSCKGAGVPWWRMELPTKMLAAEGLLNVQVLYGEMDEKTLLTSLEHADIAVFQGWWADWVWKLAAMGAQRDFKMVYDYDDHPVHISPFAQAYRNFGTQEIYMDAADGTRMWLWRDGENGFNLGRNLDHRQRHLEIFNMVDMITTTTPPLHEYFTQRHNKCVRMLPNCIDFSIYREPYTNWTRKGGRPVRIGWHGGDNHFHDIKTLGKPLADYVNSHDVELVMFGSYYQAPFAGIDPNKVIEEEWVHVEAFPYKLASLGIDVAVIPLADASLPYMQFNRYKSDIKFLEYGALKIPSLVVAGSAPYAACVDGVNALTYQSDEEFKEKLDRLCQDAELRTTLGIAAYDWVREFRDLKKNIHRWAEAYAELASPVMPAGDEETTQFVGSNAVVEGS